MGVIEDSNEIFSKIQNIHSLLKCMNNSIIFDIQNRNIERAYLLPLIEIIDEKFKNLIADYDKFDLLLYRSKN